MKSEPLNFWGAWPPACCPVVSAHINSFPSWPERPHNIYLSCWKTAAEARPENNTASVLRAQFSNHFQDSISPILRISLGGKEEAGIVIGSILHTIQTRQAEVKWFVLGQVWVRLSQQEKLPFPSHCSILLMLSLGFGKVVVVWFQSV